MFKSNYFFFGERTKHRKLKDIEGSKNIENDHIENFYIENDHIEKNDIEFHDIEINCIELKDIEKLLSPLQLKIVMHLNRIDLSL